MPPNSAEAPELNAADIPGRLDSVHGIVVALVVVTAFLAIPLPGKGAVADIPAAALLLLTLWRGRVRERFASRPYVLGLLAFAVAALCAPMVGVGSVLNLARIFIWMLVGRALQVYCEQARPGQRFALDALAVAFVMQAVASVFLTLGAMLSEANWPLVTTYAKFPWGLPGTRYVGFEHLSNAVALNSVLAYGIVFSHRSGRLARGALTLCMGAYGFTISRILIFAAVAPLTWLWRTRRRLAAAGAVGFAALVLLVEVTTHIEWVAGGGTPSLWVANDVPLLVRESGALWAMGYLELKSAAITLWTGAPWRGIGHMQFHARLAEVVPEAVAAWARTRGHTPHSLLLGWLVEHGLIGMSGALFAFVLLLKSAIHRSDALIVTLAVLFLVGIDYDLFTNRFCFVAVGLAFALVRQNGREDTDHVTS